MYQCSLDTSPNQGGDRLQALIKAAIACSILQAIAGAGIETSINEGS